MKNKKKTYIYLVIVIATWGTFAYKLITAYSTDTDLPIEPPKLALSADFKLDYKKDTFSLKPIDRDPFLGKIYNSKVQKQTSKVYQKKNLWKPIEYLGLIAKGKEKVFIVSVNNNQQLFKFGQELDSVKLIRGNKKQVTLRYKNQNKTFKLKK